MVPETTHFDLINLVLLPIRDLVVFLASELVLLCWFVFALGDQLLVHRHFGAYELFLVLIHSHTFPRNDVVIQVQLICFYALSVEIGLS